LCADKQVRVVSGNVAQDLRQLAGGELARSTGAVAELGEPPQPLVHLPSPRRVRKGDR